MIFLRQCKGLKNKYPVNRLIRNRFRWWYTFLFDGNPGQLPIFWLEPVNRLKRVVFRYFDCLLKLFSSSITLISIWRMSARQTKFISAQLNIDRIVAGQSFDLHHNPLGNSISNRWRLKVLLWRRTTAFWFSCKSLKCPSSPTFNRLAIFLDLLNNIQPPKES